MSAIPIKKHYTEAEFLEFERSSSVKHEFFDGAIFAMAGASRQHNQLARNFGLEIGLQLKGCSCELYIADLRVKVRRTGLLTYPDLLIVCGEQEYLENERPDTLLNPQVIIEVLSPSTQEWDRDFKFQHYQKIPSMREYVLVSQDKVMIDHQILNENGQWERQAFFKMDEEFAFHTVPVRVKIADIYRGVTLTDPMK